MKYILWPPFAILICIIILIRGVVRMLWSLVWHFRVMTVREAYSNDEGEFFFGVWGSCKEFFKDLLIYSPEE